MRSKPGPVTHLHSDLLAALESDLGGGLCAVFGFCRLRPSQLLDKIQNRATPLAKEVTPFASGRNCQPNRLQAFIAKAIDGKHCAGVWRHRLDQHRQPLGTGSEHSAEKTIGYRGRSFRLMACHRDSPPFLPRLLASQWLIFGGALPEPVLNLSLIHI